MKIKHVVETLYEQYMVSVRELINGGAGRSQLLRNCEDFTKRAGFKVGDRVVVTRALPTSTRLKDRPEGWTVAWNSNMDVYVNAPTTIVDIDYYGVYLDWQDVPGSEAYRYVFPWFILEYA